MMPMTARAVQMPPMMMPANARPRPRWVPWVVCLYPRMLRMSPSGPRMMLRKKNDTTEHTNPAMPSPLHGSVFVCCWGVYCCCAYPYCGAGCDCRYCGVYCCCAYPYCGAGCDCRYCGVEGRRVCGDGLPCVGARVRRAVDGRGRHGVLRWRRRLVCGCGRHVRRRLRCRRLSRRVCVRHAVFLPDVPLRMVIFGMLPGFSHISLYPTL